MKSPPKAASNSKSSLKKEVNKRKREKENKRKKNARSPAAKESHNFFYCFVCGEEYIEPPTEEWMQCESCAVWVHEQCANIEGTIFVCENYDDYSMLQSAICRTQDCYLTLCDVIYKHFHFLMYCLK